MELPRQEPFFDPRRDALYSYDGESQRQIIESKPWKSDPHYFKTVRISAIAMVKMVMHARSGGSMEIMGLMQGYVDGTTMVVTDAFRLPVDGTETRVNAQDEANEFIVEYLQLCREEGRLENAIGWYHSHPGYGCWLSGIDVSTQSTQQQYSDPFLAVVIDPERTISANKVDIGAFRTYPDGYTPAKSITASSSAGDGSGTVPRSKADDFGAHSNRYYSLEVEHYKSSLDDHLIKLLWNKYWVQTLAQNPLLTNRDYGSKQMVDLGYNIKDAAVALSRVSRGGGGGGGGMGMSAGTSQMVDKAIEKTVCDARQVAAKEQAGLTALEIKAQLFSAP